VALLHVDGSLPGREVVRVDDGFDAGPDEGIGLRVYLNVGGVGHLLDAADDVHAARRDSAYATFHIRTNVRRRLPVFRRWEISYNK
jgi:hypothetical protein